MRHERDRRRGVRRRGRVADDRGRRRRRRARDRRSAPGLAWAGSLDPDVIDETLREARDNAAFGEPDEWYGLASPGRRQRRDRAPALDLWRDELAQRADRREGAHRARARTRDEGRRPARSATSSRRATATRSSEAALANSLGVEAYTRRTTCSASSVALADDGSGTQTGYGFVAGRTLADLDLDSIPRDAATRACRLLGAKPIPGRRIPVILDPLVTRSVLGVLSSAFNGESMLKGRSLFTGRAGEQVGGADRAAARRPDRPRARWARRRTTATASRRAATR